MQEQSKVFVVVFRNQGQGFQYLALKPNPEPGRNTDYYVVTGGVENGETTEDAAKREVQEEIGARPTGIIDLNTPLVIRIILMAKDTLSIVMLCKFRVMSLGLMKSI